MSYNALDIEVDESAEPLLHEKHAKYFVRFLNLLPARLASHDSTRGMIAFFAVCGLDALNSLHLLTPQMRTDIIEWIYGCLVESQQNDSVCSGFLGTRAVSLKTDDEQLLANVRHYQCGHLAMTYTSIGVLVTLGDDLSRLDRKSIVNGVAAVQQLDGTFSATLAGGENDMRFVYCAAAICHMLDYWGDVDKEAMYNFIKSSIRYDNGFSQHLDGEAHGGTTFCAVAALELTGQLQRLGKETLEGITRWLVFRQVDGFQGRPNKPVDTCYSFWIGAALRILGAFELTDYAANRRYILETQDPVVGGFSKWPQSTTDPFHTYFGLCGLSFMKEPGLKDILPSLNIPMSAYLHLQDLHRKWRGEFDPCEVAGTSGSATKRNGDESETITSPMIKAQ